MQDKYEMDVAFDMIDESDGGDTYQDYDGDFTEISITLSDYSPTRGRSRFLIRKIFLYDNFKNPKKAVSYLAAAKAQPVRSLT